ncbi:bile acid:sodium symporter [Lampropedia puyangensis]|uniref:Bile acid:sodium symporter n=1 Tax=Lampropedia puyangensis TaxID=1330072 RepID=A0A4V4GS72_9BURK|nr:bile acid:sodium symporter family protein [Lampropedia puyangensis]THU04136.1 bile acid:sodium symporter [Lampropedia puyangensis]
MALARNFKFKFDRFTLILISVILLASFLPAQGQAETAFKWLTNAAIALLFFMHGAKLSRQEIVAGATHWRLHLVVFGCTFAFFPLLGLLLKPLIAPLVGNSLYLGILYMCALPATVQSAIAFTSLARGNIPAAICSAAASSLIGIFITPLLVLWLLGADGDQSAHTIEAIKKIVVQLLIPFIAGQIARHWIGGWVSRNKSWLKNVDQTSIVLVVYTAFSQAVNQGLWSQVPLQNLLGLVLVCCAILAIVLFAIWFAAKLLGFNLEDRITILFAGSKKSLATGVPMAQVLFTGGSIGIMLLPIMIFHQIQLMVCAVLAKRFAARPSDSE